MIFYLLGCLISCIAIISWVKYEEKVVKVEDIIPILLVTLCSWSGIIVGLIFIGVVWVDENGDKELF